MNRLKLLIVDDVETNRLILTSVCAKLEGFEIREAQDGTEAIDAVVQWHPDIILMDILMPKMNGFDASKIIKARHPNIVIIAITAVVDSQMEESMASIGVVSYIHKPIDRGLVLFKLESIATLLRSQKGTYKSLLNTNALNVFSTDIRRFKTTFDVDNSNSMMDFGMWIVAKASHFCFKVDLVLELFYTLFRQEKSNGQFFMIVVEESFDEIFITIECEEALTLNSAMLLLVEKLGEACIVNTTRLYVRLPLDGSPVALIPPEIVKSKEIRIVEGEEKVLLRQSFVQKTAAKTYVDDIGGDVLDEIGDLSSSDSEWKEYLHILEQEATSENLHYFADVVLGAYVHVIHALYEFTALGYALSSLSLNIKANIDKLIHDPAKFKTFLMLLEHLGDDLKSWKEHVFIAQDTADIHYLDSSFFSSCMQIEGIISDKEVASDDDNDMEFF